MDDSLISMIEYTITWDKESPPTKLEISGTVLIVLLAIVVAAIIFLPLRKTWGKIAFATICCGVIAAGIAVGRVFIEETGRQLALQEDLENPVVLSTQGVIEKQETYKRSGTEIYIKGVYYRIMPQVNRDFGDVKVGWCYMIEYLQKSKYVCAIQVIEKSDLAEYTKIEKNDYHLFSDSFNGIEYPYQAGDISFEYIRNFFYSIDKEKGKRFDKEGWKSTTYYRKDLDAYTTCLVSNKNNKSMIYIIIDKTTGVPMYFRTEGFTVETEG